jgi:hypothetical protein
MSAPPLVADVDLRWMQDGGGWRFWHGGRFERANTFPDRHAASSARIPARPCGKASPGGAEVPIRQLAKLKRAGSKTSAVARGEQFAERPAPARRNPQRELVARSEAICRQRS